MVSKNITEKIRIYDICKNSGDIRPDETFRGIIIAHQGSFDTISTNTKIVCCGKVSDNELLLRTEDGRYYFSIYDGWGEEHGILYGLRFGIFFDFKHPTTTDIILAECEANIGSYRTWGGAMAYQVRKHTLDVICSVMQNAKPNP